MKVILQHDEHDCGAICLSMIATYYGLRLPVSKYRELTKTDKTGTNIYGLIDGAKKIGLEASGLSGTPEELMDGIKSREITFPFIAHTVSKNGMLHYVVVFGQQYGKLLVGDPGEGKLRLTLEEFFQRWTGYIVTFEITDKFIPSKNTQGSFSKIFLLLKGQYKKLIGIILISLVINAVGILGAFVFEIVIDNFATNTSYYEEMDGTDTGAESEDELEHEGESVLLRFLEKSLENIEIYSFNIIFIALICLYLLQALIQNLYPAPDWDSGEGNQTFQGIWPCGSPERRCFLHDRHPTADRAVLHRG